MNCVQLIGRLTADPAPVRTTEAGEVTTLRVAVPRRRTDDSVDFVTVEVWKNLALVCAEHLKSGREIAVDGRLSHHEWQTDEGQRRERLVIVARDVRFLRQPASTSVDTDIPF